MEITVFPLLAVFFQAIYEFFFGIGLRIAVPHAFNPNPPEEEEGEATE